MKTERAFHGKEHSDVYFTFREILVYCPDRRVDCNPVAAAAFSVSVWAQGTDFSKIEFTAEKIASTFT